MMTNERDPQSLRSLRSLESLMSLESLRSLLSLSPLRIAGVVLAVGLAGCDRNMSIAEIEAKERTSRLYTTAMEDLQAGRTDPAIRGFEHVLVQEPRNYSAHFQLATLLQDIKKDYIGAISHYKSYLLFRPTSDKATIASDRMRVCDTLLGAEYLRKAGGKPAEKLSEENAKLEDEARKLREQVKRLEAQLAKAQGEAEQLAAANKRYMRQISSIGAEAEGGAPRKDTVAKAALAELKEMAGEQQRRKLRPTDAELLDDDSAPEDRPLLAEARRLKAESEKDEKDAPRKTAPLAQPAKPGAADAAPAAPATGAAGGALDSFWANRGDQQKKAASRPETYVVQPGDTLSKISRRFYGSPAKWRAIREANKAIVPFDGRVTVGQELRLP